MASDSSKKVSVQSFHDFRDLIPDAEISLAISIPSLGLKAWRMKHNAVKLEPFCLATHTVDIYQGQACLQSARIMNKTFHTVQSPGSLFIISAGGSAEFWFNHVDQDDFQISLDPTLFNLQALELGLDPDRIELSSTAGIRDALIEHVGLAIEAEVAAENPHGSLFIEELASLLVKRVLLDHCVQHCSAGCLKTGFSKIRLRDIFDYIDAHLFEDLSLVALAGQAGLSKFYFSQVFKNLTGYSPHQYVLMRRIEAAKHLLNHSNMSITQIALSVGCQSSSQFSRLFQKQTGLSPKAFRRPD